MFLSKVSVCIYSTVTKPQEDSKFHIESFSNNDSVGYKLVEQSVEEVVWIQEESSGRDENDDIKQLSLGEVTIDDDNEYDNNDDDDDDDNDDDDNDNDDSDDDVVIEVELGVTSTQSVEYVVLYIDQ